MFRAFADVFLLVLVKIYFYIEFFIFGSKSALYLTASAILVCDGRARVVHNRVHTDGCELAAAVRFEETRRFAPGAAHNELEEDDEHSVIPKLLHNSKL